MGQKKFKNNQKLLINREFLHSLSFLFTSSSPYMCNAAQGLQSNAVVCLLCLSQAHEESVHGLSPILTQLGRGLEFKERGEEI